MATKLSEKKASKKTSKPRKKRVQRASIEKVLPVVDAEEMIEKPLFNTQREKFCQAALSEPSATAAAIKAGYSPATARQQASRLLTNVDVQRRLAFLLSESAENGILRRQSVLRNASSRAAAAITDFADLMRLPWSEFCDKVQDHPAARAIKRVKRKVVYNAASGKFSEPFVEEIELFDPRTSERLLSDLLGWEAPKAIVPVEAGGGSLEGGNVYESEASGEIKAPRGVIYLPIPIRAPRADDDQDPGDGGGVEHGI